MEFKYAVIIALLLAVPMVYADSGNMTSDLLTRSMAQVTCKTDFSVGLVNDITTNVPSASSLSSYATKLQSDESQLQTYASSGDSTDFKTYVQGTYDPDLQSLNSAIRTWRSTPGKNLSLSTLQTLKSDDTQLRTTLESCQFANLQAYANDKVQWYNSVLSDAQTSISNLGAKGIDTTALSSLVSDAQSTVVTPLQSAVSSATDSKGIIAALQQYCLYDGCKTGSYHFAARWDIAKTSAIESYLQGQNNSANYTSQFSQVSSDVSQSQSALNTVGSSAYAPGQSDSVFNPLKDAANVLKQILRGMRS